MSPWIKGTVVLPFGKACLDTLKNEVQHDFFDYSFKRTMHTIRETLSKLRLP